MLLEIDPERDARAPRPAATVVLARDAAAGLEVFLLRRSPGVAFMGGAYVFPGGRVDAGDAHDELAERAPVAAAAAEALGAADVREARAFVVAAVRETLEESGLLLGRASAAFEPDAARRELAGGKPFHELARDLDIRIDVEALVPFARWVTPAVERRRYDARFFVALAPPGDARHDESETVANVWMSPEGAVEAHLAARIDLPPPTLRTLEELGSCKTAADVLALARSRRPPLVRPVFRDLGGTWVLALPGDIEHPEKEAVLPGPTRFTMRDARFVSG